jgi:hypothetical protein
LLLRGDDTGRPAGLDHRGALAATDPIDPPAARPAGPARLVTVAQARGPGLSSGNDGIAIVGAGSGGVGTGVALMGAGRRDVVIADESGDLA